MCKAVNELFADEIESLKKIVADQSALITRLRAENEQLKRAAAHKSNRGNQEINNRPIT